MKRGFSFCPQNVSTGESDRQDGLNFIKINFGIYWERFLSKFLRKIWDFILRKFKENILKKIWQNKWKNVHL